MTIIESISLSFKNLWISKIRTFLTLFGIIIGIMSIILLVSVIVGTKTKIENEMMTMGSNLVMIFPGNDETPTGRMFAINKLRLKHVEILEVKNNYNLKICPEVDLMGVIVKYKKESRDNCNLVGAGANFEEVYNWKINKGKFFKKGDVNSKRKVAIIGETIVNSFFKTINPIGKEIFIKGEKFKIIGVMESKGKMFDIDMDDTVYIPVTTSQNLKGSLKIDQINVKIPDSSNIDKAVLEIKRLLEKDLNKENFSVKTQGEILTKFNKFTNILSIVTYIISGISLLVGGIGIMNIMIATVTERKKEIGIRKAVGATFGNIVTQFLIESCILALIGGIIGIVLSLVIIKVASPYIPFPLKASKESILLAFSFSSFVGIFFGTYPAIKAGKVDPITALNE
ncbi:MAG: ABC transporter permease [bacterium]